MAGLSRCVCGAATQSGPYQSHDPHQSTWLSRIPPPPVYLADGQMLSIGAYVASEVIMMLPLFQHGSWIVNRRYCAYDALPDL